MGMKVNWENRLLRDICQKIQYGHTASAKDEPIGPKFLRITDIVPETIDWLSVPHCEIEPKKKDKYLIKSGDILIARTGATTGYAKYIKAAPESIFASYLVRLQLVNWVDPRYIGYVVESAEYKEFIRANWGGAAQPNANAQVLTSFHVPTPPFPTQRKIAAILSAYDDLIENNLRRIKILEEMAQNLYREWFVKFRFPGHQNARFVDSPMGRFPEGWEVKRLDEIAKVITKGTTPTTLGKKYSADGINFFKVESLDELGGIVEEKLAKIDSETHQLLKRSQICAGDILFSIAGAIGRVILVPLRVTPANTNQALAIIRIPNEKQRTLVFYHVRADEFQNFSLGRVVQTAQANVSLGILKSAPVLIPQEEVLNSFFESAFPLMQLQENFRSKNTILRRTRDLLLLKLISGEVDVSELDIAIPEEAAA